jgi:predicted metal-dependent hydrolase
MAASRIGDLSFRYSTVYRDIKYPRIELKTGDLILVLPRHYRGKKEMIERHRVWINRKKEMIASVVEEAKQKKISKLREDLFRDYVSERSVVHCRMLKKRIRRIYFRTMRSKWASCSSSDNLIVNSLARSLPKHLIDYIVFHEIAHTIERKHNERFWRIVEKRFPQHQDHERELFAYWFLLKKMKAHERRYLRNRVQCRPDRKHDDCLLDR